MIKNVIIILLILPWLIAATPCNDVVTWYVAHFWMKPMPQPARISIVWRQDGTKYIVGSGMIIEPNDVGIEGWEGARGFVVPGGIVEYKLDKRPKKAYGLEPLYK